MSWHRNYYQDQFGDRVRNVAKEGASRQPSGASGGSGRGAGVAVMIVVGVVLAVFRGISSYPSRHEPPRFEMPRFDPNLHMKQFDHPEFRDEEFNRLMRELHERQRLRPGDPDQPDVAPARPGVERQDD